MDKEYEKELTQKAKDNLSAFGELYDYYLPKIYQYIYRRIGNKEDTEDITSLTFEKALSNLKKFHWRGISFGAWLYRIANNNINDFYRQKYKFKEVALEKVSMKLASPNKEIEEIENTINFNYLREALNKMPSEGQEIISLKFFEEMKNEEIAEIMGCNKNNLAVKIYRYLKQLKSIIEESKNGGGYDQK